jgi:hypothetical protein
MESKKMMKKEIAFMKKKGAPKSMLKHEKAEAKGMNKGGKTSCYATGGAVKVPPKPYVPTAGDLNEKAGGDQEMENRSQTRGAGRGPMSRNAMKPKAYAAGGMVRADGCATKGKTKGRFI